MDQSNEGDNVVITIKPEENHSENQTKTGDNDDNSRSDSPKIGITSVLGFLRSSGQQVENYNSLCSPIFPHSFRCNIHFLPKFYFRTEDDERVSLSESDPGFNISVAIPPPIGLFSF